MNDKVIDLKELVRGLPDRGAEIALGGFAITRCPIAFACELIRQQKTDLTLYEIIGSMDLDMLVGAGLVKKVSYGGGSLDRFGRLGRVNEAIEKGSYDIREYSAFAITLRFAAGALGIPFIPTKTPLGTDIVKKLLVKEPEAILAGESPFDQEKYLFLRALNPEYAVIHCQYADRKGNVITAGPVWDLELAKSAKKLIVTVDQIVSTETVKRFPEQTIIPSVLTHAVVEVPFGAYPTSVYKNYDYDAEALTRYAKVNMKQADFDQWLAEYVFGTKDHNEFVLKMAGLAKLNQLKADPVFGYSIGGDSRGSK